MNPEELIIIIRALKLEILDLLLNSNMQNDKEAQQVIKAIDNTFKQLSVEVNTILPPAVLQSYMEGLAYANDTLYSNNMADEKSGYNFGEGINSNQNRQAIQSSLQTQIHYQAISEVNDNLLMDLQAALRTARENTETSIVNALVGVQRDLQSGIIRGKNRRYITQQVMKSFSDNGFHAFTSRDGSKIQLDTYAETVVRTNLKIANTRAAVNRYQDGGVRLFKVGGNTPTCHQCYRYRNIVFSMDPNDEDFPYLDPNSVPFHPNCQCSIRPYVYQYRSNEEIKREMAIARKFNPEKDTRSPAMIKAYNDKQALNRMNNYEKKRYIEIKAVMGDYAPKTLGAFKRMKRQQTDNYFALLEDYHIAIKSIQ